MSHEIGHEKVKLLKDFHIKVTEKQKEHMLALPNKIQLENYCRELIARKLA